MAAPPPPPGSAGLPECLFDSGEVGRKPAARIRVGGGGRGAGGFVRVHIPAPGRPREDVCSLAQDGDFYGMLRPRAPQKTRRERESESEASRGCETVMLRVGLRECREWEPWR